MSRIIAGFAGGRRIVTPSGAATRPTTDRVREAVFSAIAAWAGRADRSPGEALRGLSFCDLYAGSGAVGLEAASRGATPVLLVERNARTADLIRQNARRLQLAADVVASSVDQFLRRPAGCAYDVVFTDPPYDQDSAQLSAQLADLIGSGWLADDGLLLVERSRRSEPLSWPDGWASRPRTYGETIVFFASRDEPG